MGVTEKDREGERPRVMPVLPSLVSCESDAYVCESDVGSGHILFTTGLTTVSSSAQQSQTQNDSVVTPMLT